MAEWTEFGDQSDQSGGRGDKDIEHVFSSVHGQIRQEMMPLGHVVKCRR